MDEEKLNEEIMEEKSGVSPAGTDENLKENISDLKESDPDGFETPADAPEEPEYEGEPDPEPELLKKDTKEALIIGAVLGLVIGLLMFFVPSSKLEEGARLTISVILILLGPRLIQDKYRLDFSKGRFTMAGALVLVLIIYILIGHPVG